MIAVLCPGCQRRVLLPTSHITCLVTSRTDAGQAMHLLGFRCWCSHTGATLVQGPPQGPVLSPTASLDAGRPTATRAEERCS